MQTITNTTIIFNPPIDNTPDVLPFWNPITIGAVIVCIVGILLIFLVMHKEQKSRDIDPTLDDLMSEPYDPNKAAIIMMVVTFPVMFGAIYGLAYAFVNIFIGTTIMAVCIMSALMPYFILKLRAREASRNMKKMEGVLWTKDKRKRRYLFAEIDFEEGERELTNQEKLDILGAKDCPIDEAALGRLHPIAGKINKKYNAYFLFEQEFAKSIVWVDGDEFDYYGSYIVKMDSPVLKEITKIQRVQVSSVDSDDMINEHVFIFWVMWDDAIANKRMAGQDVIDVTDNEIIVAIEKARGTDRKVIAGTVNALNAELEMHQEHGVDFDDIVASVGRKKALDFKRNENSLTSIDLSLLKGNVSVFTAVLFGIVMFFIGYFLG